jgi:hypothetical protein
VSLNQLASAGIVEVKTKPRRATLNEPHPPFKMLKSVTRTLYWNVLLFGDMGSLSRLVHQADLGF